MNYKNYKNSEKKANYYYRRLLSSKEIDSIFNFQGVNFFNCLDFKLYYFLLRFFAHSRKKPKVIKEYKYLPDNLFTSPLSEAIFSLIKSRVIKLKSTNNNEKIEKLKIAVWHIFFFLYKRIKLKGKVDIIFVLPAQHSIKLLSLFKKLRQKRISYLLVVHNLDLKSMILLYLNSIFFIDRKALFEIRNKILENELEKVRNFWKQFNKNKGVFKTLEKVRYLKEIICTGIDVFLKSEALDIVNNITAAHRLIKESKPKALVTTTDPDIKILPYIFTAKKLKVPAAVIQHGIYSAFVNIDFKSDLSFIWGHYSRKWFKRKLAKTDDTLYITGSPFYDKFRVQKYKRLNKNIEQVNILILCTIPHFMEKEFAIKINQFIKILTKLRVKRVIIRPHPWQTLKDIDHNPLQEIKTSIVVDSGKSLSEDLELADIVLTMDTTVGFDAIILGKFVIYWNFFGEEYLPYSQGGIPVISNSTQLFRTLVNIIENKYFYDESKKVKFLEDIFFNLDGKSSDRIIAKLENIIRIKKP